MDNNEVNTHATIASQAYIFTKLYNKGFIKSKSLTFTKESQDLLLKIHHLIKTSMKKEIEKSYSDIFSDVRFSSFHGMKVSIIVNNQYGKLNIFTSRVNEIIANARIGLSPSMILTLNGSSLIYKFDKFHSMISPLTYYGNQGHNGSFDLKSNLDNIINCIMYIPISIQLIGSLAKEINKIDDQYVFTLKDIKDYLSPVQHLGSDAKTILENIETYSKDDVTKLDHIIDIPIEIKQEMHKILVNRYNYATDYQNVLAHLMIKTGELNG